MCGADGRFTMSGQSDDDQYSEQETAYRLQKISRGALSGPPTPLKDIPTMMKKCTSSGYTKTKLLAIIVTAQTLCDGSAPAEEFKTGNELLDDSTIAQSLDYSHTAAAPPERAASAFYCLAYIAGVNHDITAGGKL
jgi:hypothetical protein